MTLSTYLNDMLTPDEHQRIHGMTSPVFLSDSDRELLERYKLFFTFLREHGVYAELDYVHRKEPVVRFG